MVTTLCTASLSIPLPSWSQVTGSRSVHIQRVARLAARWADEMSVSPEERDRWIRAVALHDSLKEAPQSQLSALVTDRWGVPSLLHGPAAAVLAEQHGETDHAVLDAVRYHSVGFAGWEVVGKVLYLADFLEPGRPFHTDAHEELAAAVPQDVDGVLRSVAAERITGQIAQGLVLLPETVEFWNSIVPVS